MQLDRLLFVTSSVNKRREAEAVLGRALEHHPLDLAEIQSLDVVTVVEAKARAAYARLERPVLVEDTALELAALGGFPGPLIRWLLETVGAAGIARIVAAFDDDRATARCAAAACNGEQVTVGVGAVDGRIADAPRGPGGFGWDSVFMPEGEGGATYAEMSEAAKNAISHRRRAFEALRDALER
jgi:non-canonical purine NTP pyrophosphatase (RdgB/HAM1 family)